MSPKEMYEQMLNGVCRCGGRGLHNCPLSIAPPGTPPVVINNANDVQVGGSHYQTPIQTWDYIAANGIGYFEGNIIKYVSRWEKKGGVQDLEKARHYLDKLIELAKARKSP